MFQLTEEVEVVKLVHQIDPKTKQPCNKRCPFVKSGSIVVCRIATTSGSVLIEKFSDYPQLGRFTLRDEGKTIAIGKVLRSPGSRQEIGGPKEIVCDDDVC